MTKRVAFNLGKRIDASTTWVVIGYHDYGTGEWGVAIRRRGQEMSPETIVLKARNQWNAKREQPTGDYVRV